MTIWRFSRSLRDKWRLLGIKERQQTEEQGIELTRRPKS
jgi:hypothetical protein